MCVCVLNLQQEPFLTSTDPTTLIQTIIISMKIFLTDHLASSLAPPTLLPNNSLLSTPELSPLLKM